MTLFPHINPPALYFSTNSSLVIAELHIGLGLLPQTAAVGGSVFEVCKEDLMLVAEKTHAKRLIVNGDLKESIGKPNKDELELLKRFEKFVCDLFDEVVLVKGNHDGLIAKYVGFKVVESYSFVEDAVKVNIQHGHIVKPNPKPKPNMLILGHLHPSVRLPDGSKVFAWVFLRRRNGTDKNGLNNIIIMPPFNRFVGGGIIDKDDLQERLNLSWDLWDSMVVGVNGLFFGGLESFVSER